MNIVFLGTLQMNMKRPPRLKAIFKDDRIPKRGDIIINQSTGYDVWTMRNVVLQSTKLAANVLEDGTLQMVNRHHYTNLYYKGQTLNFLVIPYNKGESCIQVPHSSGNVHRSLTSYNAEALNTRGYLNG